MPAQAGIPSRSFGPTRHRLGARLREHDERRAASAARLARHSGAL